MSNGKPQDGQQYNQGLNIQIPFVEQMLDRKTANADEGTAGMEITPNDSDSALSRQYDIPAAQGAYESAIVAYDTYISLDLPDVLSSVNIVYNTTSSDGSSTQEGTGSATGADASLALSIHGSGQGGATIQPEIEYTVDVTPKDNIVASVRVFYAKAPIGSPLTMTDILTKLSSPTFFNETVSLIPLWRKSINALSLRGQQVSLSATADAQERVSIAATDTSQTINEGTGYSYSFGSNSRSVQLPATINAGFSTATTQTASASASATANIAGGSNWDPVSASLTVGPTTVTGTSGPDIVATPQTSIPTSGLYLVKVDVTPFAGFGENMVRAEVVNFAQFA